MGGLISGLFGTNPQQQGEAISGGQSFWGNALQGMMQQGVNAGMSGNQLYPTQNAQSQGYTAQGYSAPDMQFSSPTDYLQQGEMDTARNIMEQFGSGSARGGQSGSGYDMEAGLSSKLAQGSVARYMDQLYRYDQMKNQEGQFNASSQNEAMRFGAGSQNQANMFNAGQANQSYAAPWQLTNQFPTTYGSPVIGEGGMASMMPGGSFMPGSGAKGGK